MEEVINAVVPEDDRIIVRLHAGLLMNTIGGRPSDCARQAVRDYQRLGRHGFIRMHGASHDNALRTCGCETCLSDLARETVPLSSCVRGGVDGSPSSND
jgi:hypothetical protein